MAFIDVRLPLAIELNAERVEREDLSIVTTDAGYEVRNARHAQAMYEYEISFPPGDESTSVRKDVKDLWKVTRGGLHTFRMRDHDPYNRTITDQQIGIGDGTTTTFQLVHTWTLGSTTVSRKILLPVDPIVIKKDDVVSGGYTVNYTTGVITFSVAPLAAVVITATCTYDMLVRFAPEFTSVGLMEGIEDIGSLTIVEVKQ